MSEDRICTDVASLAGHLDACLDGIGRTDVSAEKWLSDFLATRDEG